MNLNHGCVNKQYLTIATAQSTKLISIQQI